MASKKIPLHLKIFIGMMIGIIAGIIIRQIGLTEAQTATFLAFIKPISDIFLRLIFMMVIPLIISALALGINEMGDMRKIGRVGWRTLVYTLTVSAVSVLIGVAMISIFAPGKHLAQADKDALIQQFSKQSAKMQEAANTMNDRTIADIIVSIIPKNPLEDMVHAFDPSYTGGGLLAVMFFALCIGLAMLAAPEKKVQPLKDFFEALYEVTMQIIQFAMRLAPFGVAALLCTVTIKMGIPILFILFQYVLVVLASLAIHQFVVYSAILKFGAGVSPRWFFKNSNEVMMTAFSTSSSNATLPTAIRVTKQKLGVQSKIAHFVLTIGSTANQNGTALYEGVTVLFIAQCFGLELALFQQITVVVLCILGGIGTAGVPGGSLPIVMLILASIGIPAESIAIIYGVDRILDMCRTVLNVTGDMVAAVYINAKEGE